jgi:hypothetical protein
VLHTLQGGHHTRLNGSRIVFTSEVRMVSVFLKLKSGDNIVFLFLNGSNPNCYEFPSCKLFSYIGHMDYMSMVKLSKITVGIKKIPFDLFHIINYSRFKHSILLFSILQIVETKSLKLRWRHLQCHDIHTEYRARQLSGNVQEIHRISSGCKLFWFTISVILASISTWMSSNIHRLLLSTYWHRHYS